MTDNPRDNFFPQIVAIDTELGVIYATDVGEFGVLPKIEFEVKNK